MWAADALAKQVLERRVAITAVCMQIEQAQRQHRKHGCKLAPPLQRLARQAGHILSHTFAGFRCEVCCRKIQRRHLERWVDLGCCPGPPQPTQQPLHYRPLAIGRQVTHNTHRRVRFKRLVWCWTCGCYAITKIRGLKDPCREPGEKGKRNLSRLRKGEAPTDDKSWPQELAVPVPFPQDPDNP